MWQIGDEIICIVDFSKLGYSYNGIDLPKLIYGKKYIISDISECSCGNISFDVGLITNKGIMCASCSEIHPRNGIWWCYESCFAKYDSQEECEFVENVLENTGVFIEREELVEN